MSTHEPDTQERRELAGRISIELVGLVKKYTGRGPVKAFTLLDRDYLVTFFGQTMTETEQALTEHGRADFASQMREMIHATMRSEVETIVQRLTGRAVIAVLADHSAEPDIGLLACVLEPAAPRKLTP